MGSIDPYGHCCFSPLSFHKQNRGILTGITLFLSVAPAQPKKGKRKKKIMQQGSYALIDETSNKGLGTK